MEQLVSDSRIWLLHALNDLLEGRVTDPGVVRSRGTHPILLTGGMLLY